MRNQTTWQKEEEQPCNQKGWICDGVGTNSNVTLLDEFNGLTAREIRGEENLRDSDIPH
jgi:hypothetical protein